MESKLKSNKNSEIYNNYLRVLPFFKDLLSNNKKSLSDYWAEEVLGFEYIFEASPLIINNLRHHCYHITGEFPYPYRNHHNHNSNKFKSKLELLKSLTDTDLLIPEPKSLGGFGFDINGELINLDTLKFLESMIAIEKSGMKASLEKINNPIICEIGAGWGGFAYYYCSLFPKSKYLIVDLPQTLIFSYLYLTELFPNKKVNLFGYESNSLEDCDFLLIPNTEFHNYHNSIDAAINICSFQEMTSEQVSNYINKIFELDCKFIYSLNRNMNKNNPSLVKTLSDHISEKYQINEIDILKIPYSDLNVNNLKKRKIDLIKGIIKFLIGRKNNTNVNHKYQHFLGKKQ